MRIFSALAMAMAFAADPAAAATIFTGIINPIGGTASLSSSDIHGGDYSGLPAGRQQVFTLELDGGKITNGGTSVSYSWIERSYQAGYPLGNDILENGLFTSDYCGFDGHCGSADGDPSQNLPAYSSLSFAAFNRSAVWSFSNPANFDTCGAQGTPGCSGEQQHAATLGYSFAIASSRPVSYRLTIGDPLGLDVSAVPEPATWAMSLIGFGAIGGVLRRRGASMQSPVDVAL